MGLTPGQFASAAAEVGAQAAGLVQPGMRLGLGTGRMASAFIDALRPRIQAGLRVEGLSSSKATELLARDAGIAPLSNRVAALDLDVDGADEFDPWLNLLKGGGGALLREKMVAGRSRRFWVLADSSKQVAHLASAHPLPIEVLPFDWEGTAALCEARLPCRSEVRGGPAAPFVTDNGNYLIDLHFPNGLANPRDAARKLSDITGVLGHGLFLSLATAALVFDAGGLQVLGDLDAERNP